MSSLHANMPMILMLTWSYCRASLSTRGLKGFIFVLTKSVLLCRSQNMRDVSVVSSVFKIVIEESLWPTRAFLEKLTNGAKSLTPLAELIRQRWRSPSQKTSPSPPQLLKTLTISLRTNVCTSISPLLSGAIATTLPLRSAISISHCVIISLTWSILGV